MPVPTTEDEQGDDRHFVEVALDEPGALGSEFFRFELAVAIAGHVLEIDPFDEPNVAESKANTEERARRAPAAVASGLGARGPHGPHRR